MTSAEEFDDLLRSTKRVGIENLIEWLHSTDFYEAPASAKYHGSCERGLILHSLSVYDCAITLNKILQLVHNIDSIKISALLHDICKTGCYTIDYRNKKVTDPETGSYEWVKEPYYKFDELYPFGGHGSKSVYLAQRYIPLTWEEAVAINCHMGAWDKDNPASVSKAFEEYHLAWLIHVADEMSTYVYSV